MNRRTRTLVVVSVAVAMAAVASFGVYRAIQNIPERTKYIPAHYLVVAKQDVPVGTILEVIPKVTPTPAAVAERTDEEPLKVEPSVEEKKEAVNEDEATAKDSPPVEVVVTDPTKTDEKPKEETPRRTTASNRSRRTRTVRPPKAEEVAPKNNDPAETTAAPPRRTTRPRPAPKTPAEPKVDPMANINLVIYFKDGSRIDRPMTEVLRFSVERAIASACPRSSAWMPGKAPDVSTSVTTGRPKRSASCIRRIALR